MNTLAALLQWGVTVLTSSEKAQLSADEAHTDVQVLLCFALQKNRAFLYAFPETEATQQQIVAFRAAIMDRAEGTPVAYIQGEREFWSLPLLCDASTLIPRPDTECLVERVLEIMPQDSEVRVVDLGTGTGAIALALASERPLWQVIGIDYSASAVRLANSNAEKNALHATFQQGDWLSGFAVNSLDLIVSNPPYIADDDPHLTQGDVRFEPLTALVASDQGFQDFKTISEQALLCLVPGGYLFFEHGFDQQPRLMAHLRDQGFINVTGYNDYGGQPRIVSAMRP